jgi:hypothetical protein
MGDERMLSAANLSTAAFDVKRFAKEGTKDRDVHQD